MEDEKSLTEHESLQLIRQMIFSAKKEQKDDGKGWIIWGWMLFLASILTVINIQYKWMDDFFFWNIFGGVSLLLLLYQVVSGIFFTKTEKVKTYTKDLFSKLNTGFFICLMFIIVAMNVGIQPRIGFSLLINLYAFWILIYGSALDFKPSVIGAYLTWILGFVALFAKTFEQVMLLHAAAVLVGYIIPGHIANNEFKKLHSREKI